MALGLTQPLIEMSNRNISWSPKGGRGVGLTTLPPSYADCLEIWEPQPPGTLRDCRGPEGLYLLEGMKIPYSLVFSFSVCYSEVHSILHWIFSLLR